MKAGLAPAFFNSGVTSALFSLPAVVLDGRMERGLRVLAALWLAACGGPAIQDASQHIASGRGCDSAELTIAHIDDGYHVVGCGEPAVYTCADGECTVSEGGAVNDAWVAAATGAMSGIEPEILECNGGQPVTIQVLIEPDGRVNGLAWHPEIEDDARLCIGHVVYDNVTLEADDHYRLVAYAFGGDSGADSIDEAVVAHEPDEPVVDEPVVDEPVDDDASGDDVAVDPPEDDAPAPDTEDEAPEE